MRVAIYCRVSTNDQNCERQEHDLIEYASKCGYEVVGVWSETISGMKTDRAARKEVMSLAKARDIDGVLVSELTRWGRSTSDLISTINDLHSWNVSLIAQNGFQCDLSTPHGKMIFGVMAALAEFERDLFSERVRSGVALARSKGKVFGRKPGSKADKHRKQIKILLDQEKSLSEIAKELKLSKTTVHRQVQLLK
jgi:putative DNA-invertase from lambdoid prophage Rac